MGGSSRRMSACSSSSRSRKLGGSYRLKHVVESSQEKEGKIPDLDLRPKGMSEKERVE